MKKYAFIIVMIMSVMALTVGCSNRSNNEPDPSVSEPVVLESSDENEVMYADMIPDPNEIFAEGSMSIIDSDGGERYSFQISNFTNDEYVSYVSECKELGFTDVLCDLETKFEGYTSDNKYFVSVQLYENDDQRVVNVTCGLRKK